MVTITISFIDCAFGPRLPDCSKLSINRKNDNDVINFRHDFILKYFWRDFVSVINFSYWAKFHVSIITGSGVITFFCYKGWPEIQKSEIHPSEFCPISGEWDELGIPYLAGVSVVKCYWMLQNAKSTAFTVSELLRENQQGAGRGAVIPFPLPKLGLRKQLTINKTSEKNNATAW